jgi:hypothetical protein
LGEKKDKNSLDAYLNEVLPTELVEKIDEAASGEGVYAPSLEMEELKLYKLELLEDIREVQGRYGASRVVNVLNCADNQKYTLWLPTVLYRKLLRHKAAAGTVVGVIFKGVPKGKRYRDYATFLWTPEFAAHLGLKP